MNDLITEYDSIYNLLLNWIFWFLLGTLAAYGLFTLLEYIDGRDKS